MLPKRTICLMILSLAGLGWTPASGATVEQITPTTRPDIGGKETDWIDGDFALSSDQIIAVIAKPGKHRNANMTTRGVGGGIIDLTRRDIESDQLTAIYPAGGRYVFGDASQPEFGKLDDGKGVFWRCQSSSAVSGNGTVCTVEYQLRDGESFIAMKVTISGDKASSVIPADGVRADRTFKFATLSETNIAYCEDHMFRQTYGFLPSSASAPKWGSGRPKRISYSPNSGTLSDDKKSLSWTTKIYPACSPLDLWGLTQAASPQTLSITGAVGDQPRIKLSVIEGEIGPLKKGADWRCDANGKTIVHLPKGTYRVRAEAVGHEPTEHELNITNDSATYTLPLGVATRVVAKFTDESGKPSPCKVSFYGAEAADGTKSKSPDFGIDSQAGSVGNTVYSTDGEFVRSIPPGTYEVVVSHGPECDAIFKTITVANGEEVAIGGTIQRVVDSSGWVSAELHSHSTPSGDNTSEQLGRVENLVCENLEFAPCTEHQRIESYDDQLEILGAENLMATCSGMELTGSLLPINHQNAFPLKLYPHAQDGGGPRVDGRPETQIARLAMWDDNSEKIVQTNHPNMRQMLFDRDLDGKNDGGFSKMLDFMDVIEVHPPEDIFRDDASFKDQKARDRSRIKPWMQLIKSGRRIPGVVNTDAHYNWHGSGWLRNWVRSETDEPSRISVKNMIESLETGRVIMSTGPFMSVTLHHPNLSSPAQIGDTVSVRGQAELAVKVQCPNWLDVNRVGVFVDGEVIPELTRTRADHSSAFGDDVIKFDQRLPITLEPGSFIIVAAIGEKLQLGRVMGERYGNRPPVVVSNPIYVAK